FRKSKKDEFTTSEVLRKIGSTQSLYVRLPLDTYLYLKNISAVERLPMVKIVTQLIDQRWAHVQNLSIDFSPKDRRQIHTAIRRIVDKVERNPGKKRSRHRDQHK
ncbi:hypothetical protein ACFLU3_03670, partial [Chloroflexota bacterium]